MAVSRQNEANPEVEAFVDPRLGLIAQRVHWWKTPAESIANTSDFLCRVMALGLWEDVIYVIEKYGEQALRSALNEAPPGVFDPKSWNYWHRRFGFSLVPALPKREFK
jgi:hypothetical protein